MLNRKLVRFARRLIPPFLEDQFNPFNRVIQRAVERFITGLPSGAQVLDAGAGETQYKKLFQAAGHRYWALDLAVGEPDWQYSGIDTLANTAALPFRPGIFDGVMSVAVLEHTPFPGQALYEMNGALKLGGRLFIVVPTMWEEHQMPNDFYRFTRYGLERLLERAGFRIIERTAIGGYFWFMGRKSIDLLEFFQSFPRVLLWPLLAPVFGFLIPVICRRLDWLDRDKYYTIGQLCFAEKIGPAEEITGSSSLP
jgi:SAM-dependent methyltransferase